MSKEERKIRNLEHEIEYYSRVYPKSAKIMEMKRELTKLKNDYKKS